MSERPFAVRVALSGVAVVLAGFAISFLADPAVFLAPVLLVLVLGAFFVRRGGRGGAVALLVASLPLLMLGLGEASLAFGALDSFPHFAFPLLAAGGAILTALGAVGVLLPRPARSRATRLKRVLLAAALAGLALLSLGSLVVTLRTPSEVPLRDRLGAVRLTLGDDWFRPTVLEVPEGTTRLYLRNEGLATHTFTVDELAVDRVLTPGRERLIELRADRTGTFTYYCRVSGHGEQTGRLTVT